MISIKEMIIRDDKGGSGLYRAPRRKGDKTYFHAGVDYCCIPGEDFCAIDDGLFVRIAYPYKNDFHYMGIVLETKKAIFGIFYVHPLMELRGLEVKKGQKIGTCQDISKKYPNSGVTPHIHYEVVNCDCEIIFKAPLYQPFPD